jgi:DnaJ-class molecular chaperone
MRPPSPAEERVCRALRQAGAITADESRVALELLSATEDCDRCGATGRDPNYDPDLPCGKCEGTGQMRTLR